MGLNDLFTKVKAKTAFALLCVFMNANTFESSFTNSRDGNGTSSMCVMRKGLKV